MTRGDVLAAHLRREVEQHRCEAARHLSGTTGRAIADMNAADAEAVVARFDRRVA